MVASSAPGSGQSAPIPGSGGSHVQPEKLPSLLIERPKMPRATWEALRNHVVRERQRKKQEREQSAEYERQKKEREHKKKQEALTLEDTKVEIANLERKLDELKAEKTQLFHTLKKVLYEDDRRRSKEVTQSGQVYLQPSVRPGPSAHYMKPHGPHPHLLLSAAPPPPQPPPPQAAPKRPRSPSPPRSSISSAYYRNPPAAAKYYGAAPNSAIASVSATHIYAMTGTSGAPGYANASPAVTSAGSASKPLYLSQQQAAAQSRYAAAAVVAAQQQQQQQQQQRASLTLAAAAPPAAHGARPSTGSILSGYPRSSSVSYQPSAVATTAPAQAQSPRYASVQPPPPATQNGGQQQPAAVVRYFHPGQREV